MIFSSPYGKINRYSKEIDELLVPYQVIENSIIDFLEEHNQQRIIICVNDGEYFINQGGKDEIVNIKKGRPDLTNYAVRLRDYYEDEFDDIYDVLVENEIPVFYANHCRTWDMLYGMLKDLTISDIYVVEELCFALDKVAELAHSKNVKVRVFPNIAQSDWGETEDIYKFFIIPEDLQYYDKYVDVYELFVSAKTYNADPIYESYRNRKWFGPIREIIYDYHGNINSKHVIPVFGERRVTCEKRCMKGGTCQICEAFAKLSQTFEEKGLYFSPND